MSEDRDQVGETRQLTEAAKVAYRELSHPDQLQPSTSPRRDQAKGATSRKGAAPPAPVDLDVLDWLLAADRTVTAVVSEVLGAAGRYADPPPTLKARGSGPTNTHGLHRWYDHPELQWPEPPVWRTVPEALDAISDALGDVPDEVGKETAARMWDLARGGAQLLGTNTPGLVRWRCPACERRSVMVRPGSDGQQAVCVHRSCRQAFDLSDLNNPSRLVA